MYLIFENDKVIGFTTSWQEADNICMKNYKLSWRFTNSKMDPNLKQLTIYNF